MGEIRDYEREVLKDAVLTVVAEDQAAGVSCYILAVPGRRAHGHQIMAGPWGISIQGDCLNVQTLSPGKTIRWYVGTEAGDYLMSKFYRQDVLDVHAIEAMLLEDLEEVADGDPSVELEAAIRAFVDAAEHASTYERLELLGDLEREVLGVLSIDSCDLPYTYPGHAWFFAVHEAFVREWSKREVENG